MNSPVKRLLELDAVLYKKLSWIRQSPTTAFYNEIDPTWLTKFIAALDALKDIKVIGTGQDSANEFHIDIAFMTEASHELLIENFYNQGEVKELFKVNMRHSSTADVAFHMASVLANTWKRPENDGAVYQRHYLYEICPSGTKLQAATKEHKNSLAYFQWMLFMGNTCSISAYYDLSHQVRHIQTIFMDYSPEVHARIVEAAKRFPSYFEKRHDYNETNAIIHGKGQGLFQGDIGTHVMSEAEFLEHMGLDQKNFPLSLL